MAASTTTSSSALSLSSSSTLVDGKPPVHLQPPSQCVSLPALPPLTSSQAHQQHRSTWKSTAYCAPLHSLLSCCPPEREREREREMVMTHNYIDHLLFSFISQAAGLHAMSWLSLPGRLLLRLQPQSCLISSKPLKKLYVFMQVDGYILFMCSAGIAYQVSPVPP